MFLARRVGQWLEEHDMAETDDRWVWELIELQLILSAILGMLSYLFHFE